jgi:hypothetical protein
MMAPATIISGIPVLGRPPSWCTLRFTACFVVCHNTAHNHGRAPNFTDTTFAKRELALNTLSKVKSVKAALSNTLFVQITKSSQDLV